VSDTRIAICFFGITRSLRFTAQSVQENVLKAGSSLGHAKVFSHFYDQHEISNPRSGEIGQLSRDEHLLLNSDWIELEKPGLCLYKHGFEDLKKMGDFWGDDFLSLRNLIHQLHSLDVVTSAALEFNPDIFVFVRPDLMYHESLKSSIKRSLRCPKDSVLLPNWQHWQDGYNDRFAICNSLYAAKAYGKRVHSIDKYVALNDKPLHAEQLLKFSLASAGVNVRFTSDKASRVRFDGRVHHEDFIHFRIKKIIRFCRKLTEKIRRMIGF